MNILNLRLLIGFIFITIVEFFIAVMMSFYVDRFDSVFIAGFVNSILMATITALFFVVAVSDSSIKLKFLYIVIFKSLFFIITYVYLTSMSDGFFLNYMVGDDRKYFSLANQYSSSLSLLLQHEGSYYGLPYAIILSIFTGIFGFVDIFRVLQVCLSLVSVLLFFNFLKNIFLSRDVVVLATIIFGLNPMLGIFSSLLFKDTLIVFLITVFLYVLSRNKKSIFDFFLIVAVIISSYFIRPFLVPVELLLVILFRLNGIKLSLKYLSTLVSTVVLVVIIAYLLKDQLLRNLDIIVLMESRVDHMASILTVDANITFDKLLAVSAFFLGLPPPNLINFGTQWFVQESLVVYPRVYNVFFSVLMYVGIFTKENEGVKRNIKFSMLLSLGLLLLGMALTGQVLSDRHKLMLYPFVGYFSALALTRMNKASFDTKCLFVFFCILVIQIYYSIVRLKLYGF